MRLPCVWKRERCDTADNLNAFICELARDHDASKAIRILLREGSSCEIDFLVNPTHFSRHFHAWGVMPCDEFFGGLLNSARRDGVLLAPIGGRLGKAPIPGSIGWPKTVTELGVPGVCHLTSRFQWLPGDSGLTCSTPSISIIVAPSSTSLSQIIATDIWKTAARARDLEDKIVMQSKLMTSTPWGRWATLLRVPCDIVLDPEAPLVNIKTLTPKALASMELLHLRPSDWARWVDANAIDIEFPSREDRMLLARAQINPNLAVPAYAILWRSLTIKLVDMQDMEDYVPIASWTFAVDSNADAFERRVVSASAWKQLEKMNPPLSSAPSVAAASWVSGLDRRLHVQVNFASPTKIEHRAFARGSQEHINQQLLHFAQFGKRLDATGASTTSAFWLSALKRGTSIPAETLVSSLDGFHLSAAQLLLQTEPPTCSICVDHTVDAMLDSCGHLFCVRCLESMCNLNVPLVCPTCRCEFKTHGWTTVRKNTTRSTKQTPELARKQQLLALLKSFEPDESVLILAEAETVDIVRNWLQDTTYHVATPSDCIEERYSNLIFSFSSPSVTRHPLCREKSIRIVQECTKSNTKIHILAEVVTQDLVALDWQKQIASLFDGCLCTSSYMPQDQTAEE